MEAGRELDALIAEKVMGLEPHQAKEGEFIFTVHRDYIDTGDYWYYRSNYGSDEVPHYSTDIAAAWLVVEQMRTTYVLDLQDRLTRWNACFLRFIGDRISILTQFDAEAATPAHAICLAALKVKGL